MYNRILFILLINFITIFIYSQDSTIQWQNCYGGSETDYLYDLIEVNDEFLMTGWTSSEDGDISNINGMSDIWLIKTDILGNLIWEKTYGGTEGEGCARIIPDGAGNFYLVGASNSSDGDVTYDPYPNSWDFWIVKIDADGIIIWDKIAGGNADETLWNAAPTDDGGVVAIGFTASSDGDVSQYFGGYDCWLVKVNTNGEIEWDFTLGTDWIEHGHAVLQTSDGGYLAGGAFALGDGGNISCEPYNYMAEAVLVKLDANLNIEWQQCYGGSGHDGVKQVMEREYGYLVVGYGGSADGDLADSGWHGAGDIWILKIDFDGNILWQKCYGGSSYDSALNFFETENGGYKFIGTSESHDGDVVGNHSMQYDSDIWIFDINSAGDLISSQCIGGYGDERVNYGALLKSNNDVIIACNATYGPSYDVECDPNLGQNNTYADFWLMEIKDTTVGIANTFSFKEKIKVYPNPAKDYVVFELSPDVFFEEGYFEVQVFNSIGMVVEKLELNQSKIVWETRSLNGGLYFYKTIINSILYQGRIIIK